MDTRFSVLAFVSILLVSMAGFASAASPNLSSIPDISVRENAGAVDRIIDLFSYSSDSEDTDSELTFDITDQSNESLISCFIENNRYISCDSPDSDRTGTSTITVQVEDSDGHTDTDTFNVRVTTSGSTTTSGTSSTPNISGLPEVRIRENSDSRSNIVDLFRYASDREDPDADLDFRIVSQSNEDLINCFISSDRYIDCDAPREDRTGTSTIQIEVEDQSGKTDSALMTVRVISAASNDCEDISVLTRTISLSQNSTSNQTIQVQNNSYTDFRITDVRVTDNSDYLLVSDNGIDRTINSNSSGDLRLEFETLHTTSDRQATVTVEIRGEFDNGGVCSYVDIGKSTLRVNINGGSSSSSTSTCTGIKLTAGNVTVGENATATENFTITNDSGSRFNVNQVKIDESSQYFSTSIIDSPDTISAGDSENIRVRINPSDVTRDRSGTATVRVSGDFANGRSCSLSSITDRFTVNVIDNSSQSGSDSDSQSDLTLSTNFISIDKGESKQAGIIVQNNTGATTCYTLAATDSDNFSAALTDTAFCLSDNESKSTALKITGTREGTASSDVRLSYDGKTKSKSITVEVNAPGTAQTVAVTAIVGQKNGKLSVILTNSGAALSDVTIKAINATAGVKFETLSKDAWNSGEQTTLGIDTGSAEGTVQAVINVQSAQGQKNIPIQFEASESGSGLGSGLFNLAATTGTWLGVVAVAALALIGAISIFSKK